jgi:phosphoribosylformylglycinamidine synthase I
MKSVKVCILRAAGTNCDRETGFAFKKAGAEIDFVHINRLISGEKNLDDYQILAVPGGFTYGDDIAAGKILANELRFKLADGIKKFVQDGKLIIGICNGFQILVKAGLLPGNQEFIQEASLVINDSGKFEDRWVYLRATSYLPCRQAGELRAKKCVWSKNLPEVIYLPIAHGEGKFVTQDKTVLERLKKKGQIVFSYCDEKGKAGHYPVNPNGSLEHIAGICDETGRILGLMPHPERHVNFSQHPRWTGINGKKQGDGLQIIKNGVEYAKKNL